MRSCSACEHVCPGVPVREPPVMEGSGLSALDSRLRHMSVYLGIDIGTSGTKTLAMQEDGQILAQTTVTYPLHSPKPGWSEQNPEDWWQATVASVQRVMS